LIFWSFEAILEVFWRFPQKGSGKGVEKAWEKSKMGRKRRKIGKKEILGDFSVKK